MYYKKVKRSKNVNGNDITRKILAANESLNFVNKKTYQITRTFNIIDKLYFWVR